SSKFDQDLSDGGFGLRFHIITLFPHLFESFRRSGVVGQALEKGIFSLELINPRDFTLDAHKTVDDRPYGGGDGMILKPEPLERALSSIQDPGRVVALTAHGRPWSHDLSFRWAREGGDVTLICGRYGGFDQRFLEK